MLTIESEKTVITFNEVCNLNCNFTRELGKILWKHKKLSFICLKTFVPSAVMKYIHP